MLGEMCEQINEWIMNDLIAAKNPLVHAYSVGKPLNKIKSYHAIWGGKKNEAL